MALNRFAKQFIGGIIIGALIGIPLATWLFFVRSVTVDPGTEVVLVDRPYIFSSFGEGVRPEPVREGRAFVFFSTSDYPVSVVPTTYTVTIDDYSSKDSFLLDFESSIQLRVTDSARLIRDFGPDWFRNNVIAPYHGIVRSVVKNNNMRDIMSKPETAEAMDSAITSSIRKHVAEYKLPIEILNITLGRARPNQEVVAQINRTAAEVERANTMGAAKEAEIKRGEAETERAKADNAYRNGMNFSQDQFISLQIAREYREACRGAATCIVTPTNTGITIPISK